jgi:hypothetical protein
LGTYNVNKSSDVLPHIVYPVFAKQDSIGTEYVGGLLAQTSNGKIAPHRLIWPAFWGTLKDGKVSPIPIDVVKKAVSKIITKEKLTSSGGWPSLTTKDVAVVLTSLQKIAESTAVYVCGGTLYRLDGSGELSEQVNHPATKPYLWPVAHNVRPAAQSLGVRRCQDCHATDAPFFFGKVAVDSPVVSERDSIRKMIEFQGIRPFYAWAFAFSFIFRPWLKIVVLGSFAVLGLVLLLYGLKALSAIAKVFSEQD